MWLYLLLFLVGLVLLIKGADWVSEHGSRLARAWGVSELVIGITLVAVATSLPELAVSVLSVITSTSQIATGTIIGSNISNIGLIIGLSAIIAPLAMGREFVKEAFVMVLFSLLGAAFLLDGMVWYEGIVLIAGLAVYIRYLVRIKKKKLDTAPAKTTRKKGILEHVLYCVIGGILVVAGAELLIHSTVNISEMIGISELIISLIAIAVGTSLPELAVSVTAAVKKMRGISVGNIIGSNIFNLTILGIASLFSVVPVTSLIVFIDIPIMLILALILLFFIKNQSVSRGEGAILLLIYAFFVYLQFV